MEGMALPRDVTCAGHYDENTIGHVPASPLNMAKRKLGTTRERAQACGDFAKSPKRFCSIASFVLARRQNTTSGAWVPSKSQMARDMATIFGKDWALRRGGGGRGKGGGKLRALSAPGLVLPEEAQYLLEPCRKRTILSAKIEHSILTSVRSFEKRFGTNMVTPVLIESIATHEILKQVPDDENSATGITDVILLQLESVARRSWMHSFLNRHRSHIHKTTHKRALEQHKAAKHQPELVLNHLRNIYHAEALAQIQRYVASTGKCISGFQRFHNIIMEISDDGLNSERSLLEERNGVIYVRALGVPLEHIHANRRFALDETPVNPDSPMLKAYTTNNGVFLTVGRSSIWTFLPVLCGNGTVTSALLLQRCQSIAVDAAKFTAANDLCVAATENAQQCDDCWLRFAEIWLKRCNTSFASPGFVYVDGHSSHVTRAFIELAAKHAIYVIVEPSHTSIILQVADVGINRFIKRRYEAEYTCSMCTNSLGKKKFDDVERLGCIVRVVQALRSEAGLIANCFEKCGLLAGYNDVGQHFPTSCFRAGSAMRDTNLPAVSTFYIKNVLSLKNLAASRLAPVVIPESVISSRQRKIESYLAAGEGFRSFYFAIGATADLDNDNGDDDENNLTVNPADVVAQGIRKLFKLGKAVNIPRGAPGRLSTGFGSLASAVDQWNAALLAEQAAIKSAAEKTARMEARFIADEYEKPIINMLITGGYLSPGCRLTRKMMVAMFSKNTELLRLLNLNLSAPRRAMVDALLSKLSQGNVEIVHNSA